MSFIGPFAAMWLICGIIGNTMTVEASRYGPNKPTYWEKVMFTAMGPVTLGIAIHAQLGKP